jgi:hypothetical protein
LGGRLTLLFVSSVAALVVAAAAWASGTGKEPRHYTAADQALARSIVLKQSDVGSSTVWHGGPKKPDNSASPSCPSFNPRQSDLLATGDAESEFSYSAAGVDYDSEAQVLQTAHMVQLDWQRSIPQPALLPCLRSILTKSLPADERIVSVARVSIPKLATYGAEIRVVINVHQSTAPTDVRAMVDELLVGRNRTEITLTTSAPYAARGPVEQSEIRLARLLVARAPATG